MNKGDYVMATKWSDGDPQDHWCVGFYEYTNEETGKHFIVDSEGVPFRHTGFHRMQKISQKRGKWLLDNSELIEYSGKSMWHWVRGKMSE